TMKKVFLLISGWLCISVVSAQTTGQKLQNAFQQFENDSQLKHAISSLYVIDAATGKVVFDKNSQVGLAPASTQKIITSVTAFELLGRDYRYKTELGYDGKIENGVLKGNLVIKGTGDPTFGSWRYLNTKRETILSAIDEAIITKGIKSVSNDFIADDSHFESQGVPNGWIWQDIGNYYGAGAPGICWNENQYDLILKSGNTAGEPVSIIKTIPELDVYSLINELKTGKKGTGDNAYIYLAPYAISGFVRGTIPPNENNFKVSGSFPNPSGQFLKEASAGLEKNGIKVSGRNKIGIDYTANNEKLSYTLQSLKTFLSPPLDSIIYWLNKKSINLYAEALVKTFAYEKQGFGRTDSGLVILKTFWKQKGLDETELNMVDGSGLSPSDRVTTHAQVEILKYAKGRDWFPFFYNSLPEYNNMKMKSGTINGVKAFCGYQHSADGKDYIFSFLVNNFSGSSASVVTKMYKVLDVLK
ncbi:MAG: D-alanyl-D-alanine carboxypeptidase/D-alanyl-D-alanine-endopeptidase, partial [Bacteroidetes bacterium]|nr:D-alanyl-D-alanine carboxypeptidase/D-alanyl-D-alanine-endopeptidase [Bacteroidota bacterium]